MTLVKIESSLPQATQEAENAAEAVIAQYSGWATAIMRVVEAKELYTLIDKKKYLEFEAWQLIGSFDSCYVDTDDVEPVIENGETTGYICHAKLLKNGVRVGGATQICGLDAFPCRGKNGSAKNNAAISAAQTWAGSKALKMRYSAVAVLGGYASATGDEMRRAGDEQDKTQHWCSGHETNWFKRGKMRNYAHPVEGSSEWCNEPVVVQQAAEKPMAPKAGPATPGLTEAQLRAMLKDEGMEWGDFEILVLKVESWADWTRHKGTPASALARWGTYKKDHPALPPDAAATCGPAGAGAEAE